METPLRRDVVKEICETTHARDIKLDLYFSHSDLYELERARIRTGNLIWTTSDPAP